MTFSREDFSISFDKLKDDLLITDNLCVNEVGIYFCYVV